MQDCELDNTLQSLGLSKEDIKSFINLYKASNYKKCENILLKYRKNILDNIHTKQNELYCLDYLLNKLKKGNDENDIK